MKKILAVILTVLLLCLPVFAHENGGLLGDVPATTDDIKIDGVKDAVYEQGLKIEIKSQMDSNEVHATGVAYLLYKDGYLYVFGEVTDDDIVETPKSYLTGQPWISDSMEVFINEKNSGEVNDTMQYRIDNSGWPCAYSQSGLQAYGDDAAAEYFQSGVKLTETGYNTEYRIPVKENTIGISFQINDMFSDGTAQTYAMVYSEATKKGPGSWNAEKYPYVTIGGSTVSASATTPAASEPADTTPAQDNTTAPATADIASLAACAALLALAGVVLSKKR